MNDAFEHGCASPLVVVRGGGLADFRFHRKTVFVHVFVSHCEAAEHFHPGAVVFSQFQRAGFILVADLDEHHRPIANGLVGL